jgi:hypothetical protein
MEEERVLVKMRWIRTVTYYIVVYAACGPAFQVADHARRAAGT